MWVMIHKKHPFAQEQRFRFIEATLLWEGSVQRRKVCEVFGIAANHVTKDFKAYQEEYPDHILFNPSLRAYVPDRKFRPIFTSGSAVEYLAMLHACAESGVPTAYSTFGIANIPIDVIPSPINSVKEEVLQSTIRAIRQAKGIKVIYNSMSSGISQTRIIWPHALQFTGIRWILRGYDSLNQKFRDFALQRIDSAKASSAMSPISSDEDTDWHTFESVIVVAHPELNSHQQLIVSREYGMTKDGTDYVWKVKIRRCLIGYFAAKYGLDSPHPLDPLRQRIVMKNRSELSRYFIGTSA